MEKLWHLSEMLSAKTNLRREDFLYQRGRIQNDIQSVFFIKGLFLFEAMMNIFNLLKIPWKFLHNLMSWLFLTSPSAAISPLLRSDYSFTASVNLLTFYPQAWDIFWNKDKIFLVARGYQSQNIFLCIKSCLLGKLMTLFSVNLCSSFFTSASLMKNCSR